MQLGESFVTPSLIPAADKVYNDIECTELVVPVRDGDAILMPSGITPTMPFQAFHQILMGDGCAPGASRPSIRSRQTYSPGSIRAGQARGTPKIAFHVPKASAAVVEFPSSLIQPD